jgi:hypothetical protein
MPNLAPIPSGTDPSQVTAMINNNFRQLNNEQITKLYNDANGTPSILIGLDSTGDSVIKVAKDGIDVTTATDANLAFNSAQNTFKVFYTGTLSVTKAASSVLGTATYTHNLGYPPSHMSFYVDTGLSHNVPFLLPSLTTGIIDLAIQAYTTNTTYEVFIKAPTSGVFYAGALTVQIKFYLLQETAG